MKLKKRKYDFCVFCGAPLTTGRRDRKFCSLVCKNGYNNEHYSEDQFTAVRNRTMRILSKNYSILCDAVQAHKTSIDVSDLVDAGFNPEYATSYKRTRGGDEVRCFDIKYRQTNVKIFNIRPTMLLNPEY